MKICKNCGEVNPNDSLFCCNCGSDNLKARAEVVCPYCHAVNDSSYEHCINCGKLLAPRSGDVYVSAPTEMPQEPTGDLLGMMSIPSESARCPNCGSVVSITTVFCPKCGISVANLHSHRVVRRKICPNCGRPNKPETDLCAYCFGSLAEAETEEMQITHDLVNLGELTVRQACLEGVSGKSVICPNCGTLNPEGEAFCLSCGLKLEIDQPKKYCPDCGAENPIDSAFCVRCRHSFEGAKPDRVQKWTCRNCNHVNGQEDMFCTHCGKRKS